MDGRVLFISGVVLFQSSNIYVSTLYPFIY